VSLELRTDRLLLTPFRDEDADEHYRTLVADPAVARYLPGGQAGTLEQAVALTHAFAQHWYEHGYGIWAVRDQDGSFVGRCGLRLLPEFGGEVELLYALARPAWGAGRATEAARASVRYGFEQAGLPELIGLVLPENIASRRVLEHCGMRFEGEFEAFGLFGHRLRVTADEFQWAGGRYELISTEVDS
jgi:ribosomal-protein-alanine N-acetyltransferase